jgi:hypothetical protein
VLLLRGRGAENGDNLVDQRFISKLVRDRTYNYIVDMTRYFDGQEFWDVTERVVQLPYTMLRAFDERGINLILLAGPTAISLPPGFYKTPEVNGLHDIGLGSMLTVELRENFEKPEISRRTEYISTPQRMALIFQTPTRRVNITSAAVPIDISVGLGSRYSVYESNVDGYVLRQNAWERQNAPYDVVSGSVAFSTRTVSAYTALAVMPPVSTQNDPDTDFALAGVSSLLNIEDVNFILPTSQISANQLNKLIAAVAMERRDVSINAPLTSDERERLMRAGMFVGTGNSVSREAALDALVKLYELRRTAD